MVCVFILKMVFREARGALRHFLFFLASIAIGVGAIVGVGSIAENFEAMTQHEAKNLLAADVEIRLKGTLDAQGETLLSELSQQGIQALLVSELVGMAANPENHVTQLVEVKAVESGYPYYGELKVEPATGTSFRSPEAVFVERGLLLRLGLEVGDAISLGDARFKISGVIQREPDKVAGPFSLGPRFLMSQEGLKRAGLLKRGSRVRWKILLKTAGGQSPEGLKTWLEDRWLEDGTPPSIKTYKEVRPRLARFLDNFTTYLGLVGLITLMIGGIGVGGNVHAFLSERTQTIAILKSLGGTASGILAIYLLLILGLSGLGALLGIGLGSAIYLALSALLSDFLPPGFVFQMRFAPIAQGLAMGMLSTFLFAIRPLRVVGEIAPARVFRHEVEALSSTEKEHPYLKQALLAATMIAGWFALSAWQAGSWRLGSWFVLEVGVAMALLMLAGKGAFLLLKRIKSPKGLVFRYGLSNLNRPGRQVMTILLSLGIGVMILLTLAQVEARLMAELRQNIPEHAPGLFLIDIQSDQKEALQKILSDWPQREAPRLNPLIRSRLHALDGKEVSEMDLEGRSDAWYFRREYVLTYQDVLPKYNEITEGHWWGKDAQGAYLSVESDAARHLGVGLGSEVTFDIQGLQIGGKITSIREVDWGSMETNFYFIFSPEALAGAPKTYVATVTSRAEDDVPIQNAVIRAFPNVTVIPIREILETIAKILGEISSTIRFMALLALTVGLIVVAGAIATARRSRIHEMVLFKTLGATRPDLMAMMAVEYAVIGFVAALVGGLLSLALSWGVVHFFLELQWVFEWQILFLGMAATVSLTLLTGFLSSYAILGEKPLSVLRAE